MAQMSWSSAHCCSLSREDGSREEGLGEGVPVISVAIKEIDERATGKIDYWGNKLIWEQTCLN